ncbi:hypothetical protein [Nitrincola sp. MINF-07-Sa-05]|uniref:hypothetical protein n=1 Tax=Nitrincola salilacus TaxID=3400273 RepID=UPI003917EBF1
MSSEQQLQARQQQAERDKAADVRRSAEAAARQAEAARQAAEMEVKRSNAAYGERLQCVLQPAEAWLNRKWRAIEPQALDLVSGMELPLVLRQPSKGGVRYSSKAYARFNGQELTLCQYSESQSATGRCVRILGNSADYRRGIRQNFQVEQFLRGHLRCELVAPRRR